MNASLSLKKMNMKIKINILDITTVNEFDFYWRPEDYINLLKEFDFADAEKSDKDELLELLYLAISDFEPDESARILLNYKLKEKLNQGQIQSISHDMLIDKVSEEYPEPALHFDLFNINQLLYKAYNGTFPNTEASIIKLTLSPIKRTDHNIDKEIIIKALCGGLKDNNLIRRLFQDQIDGIEPFADAEKTIWRFKDIENNNYQIISSKYWIDKDDFLSYEYETEIEFYDKEE